MASGRVRMEDAESSSDDEDHKQKWRAEQRFKPPSSSEKLMRKPIEDAGEGFDRERKAPIGSASTMCTVSVRVEGEYSDDDEEVVVRNRTSRRNIKRDAIASSKEMEASEHAAKSDIRGSSEKTDEEGDNECHDEEVTATTSEVKLHSDARVGSKLAAKDEIEDDGRLRVEQDYYASSDDEVEDVAHMSDKIPFIFQAKEIGEATSHVQCVVVRDRSAFGGKLRPTYSMYLQSRNLLLLVAQKQRRNRMSNYHIFDMTRGRIGSKMSKKHGNYLGKLKAKDIRNTEYVMYIQMKEREQQGDELAAVRFDRTHILDQIKEGSQPRKMFVLLPQLDADGIPVPNVRQGERSSLLDMLCSGHTGNMFLLKSKDAVYENGNYRLNFNGRVTMASVKNFQLVSPDMPNYIVCQFGKVGEDRFHLDFKAPLNAISAFVMALCQFNL